MSFKNKNIFSNLDFNSFNDSMVETVKSAVEKYWEQEIKITLRAVNDFRELRDEALIKNIDFFSSQIKVEKHKPIIVRLSGEFIESFLDITLSNNSNRFNLSAMTPLEVKILNNFSEFIYKRLKDILIPEKNLKLTEASEKNINFLFLLELKDENVSEIMISIPYDRINLKTLQKTKAFADEDFRTSYATVRIKAGSSKITLDELKNLSEDDIVVLEKSDSSKLILLSGEFEKKFNVKVNPSLILNLDDEGHLDNNSEEIYDEVIMEKNLWDDIQIEINAEFEKVKMTIGELKQITQGQVVDLGSVFDNEISLFVEDKKVAKGELIIINDRYAVRLNEVMNSKVQQSSQIEAKVEKDTPKASAAKQTSSSDSLQKPQTKVQQPSQPKQQASNKPQIVEDEEFDYSDFEK